MMSRPIDCHGRKKTPSSWTGYINCDNPAKFEVKRADGSRCKTTNLVFSGFFCGVHVRPLKNLDKYIITPIGAYDNECIKS